MDINNYEIARQQFNDLKQKGYFNKKINNFTYLYKNYPILMSVAEEIKEKFNLTRICESLYWIEHNLSEYPHCQYHTHIKCNDHPQWINPKEGYRKGCPYCGRKNPDILQKQRDGLFKKYGVHNILEIKEFKDKQNKALQTIHEKYGFGTEYFKNKMIERYGVDNATKNPELLEKSKENKALVFSDPIKRKEITDKKKKTEIERYGDLYVRTKQNKHKCSIKRTNNITYQNYVDRMYQQFNEFNIEILEPITWEQDLYSYKCTKCYTIYNTENTKLSLTRFREGKRYWCPSCYKISGNCSISEYEVGHFIKENIPDIKIEHNRRDLLQSNGREIDLYFPDYNIGIEFCGMLYHATFPYGLNGKGLSNDYHQNKFVNCLENSIYLITIFECEWMSMNNRRQTKKRVLEYFNIFEQETEFTNIEDISKDMAIDFLCKNRYWFYNINNSSIFKGLYNKYGILISVMLNIENNFILYKMNGIKINNFNNFLKQNNYLELIQDNRYPISYKNVINNLYHQSFMWEYRDGWCSDMYLKYPDNTIKNIRKINDCGYSKIKL